MIDLEKISDVTFMGITSSISTNQPNRRSRARDDMRTWFYTDADYGPFEFTCVRYTKSRLERAMGMGPHYFHNLNKICTEVTEQRMECPSSQRLPSGLKESYELYMKDERDSRTEVRMGQL